MNDDECSGPSTTATTDNIEKIHEIVLNDCRIKVREIAQAISISIERVSHIN